jgi:hypothetical protein
MPAGGDYDQTFRWLDVAYKAGDGSLILLKTDPTLDPLRDDPRFRRTLAKDEVVLRPRGSDIYS